MSNNPIALRAGAGIQVLPSATPPSAAEGSPLLYYSAVDKKFHQINDEGADTPVGTGGGTEITPGSDGDVVVQVAGVPAFVARASVVTPLTSAAAATVDVTSSPGTSTNAARADHVHAHGALTDPTLHGLATQAAHGFMSSPDKKAHDIVVSQSVDPRTFGAVGDGTTDDLGAFNAMFAALPNFGRVVLPYGYTFYLSGKLTIAKAVKIEGPGATFNTGTPSFQLAPGACLEFTQVASIHDFAVRGVAPPVWLASHAYAAGAMVMAPGAWGNFTFLIYKCTTAGTSGSTAPAFTRRNETFAGGGFNSEGATFTDGGVTWTAMSSPGLWIKSAVHANNITVQNVPGDGFYCYGYGSHGSNCSGFKLTKCFAEETLGWGYYVEGVDSSVGSYNSCGAQDCWGGGFFDNSFFGAEYRACLAEDVGLSPWQPSSASTGFDRYSIGSPACRPSTPICQRQVAAGGHAYYYVPASAGTSGTTEPTWPTTVGATVGDGTMTWKCAGTHDYGWSYHNAPASSYCASQFSLCYVEDGDRGMGLHAPAIWIGGDQDGGGSFDPVVDPPHRPMGVTVTGPPTQLSGYLDYNRLLLVQSAGVPNPLTFNLPTAFAKNGQMTGFKESGGLGGAITLVAAAGETVDGAASVTFADGFICVTLRSDGINWYVESVSGPNATFKTFLVDSGNTGGGTIDPFYIDGGNGQTASGGLRLQGPTTGFNAYYPPWIKFVNRQYNIATTIQGTGGDGGLSITGGPVYLSKLSFNGDLVASIGDAGVRATEVWARAHAGVHHDLTGAGAIAVDTQLGEMCVLTPTGPITGITLAAGKPAQRFTLQMVQAASATWPTTIGNARLAGGSFAKGTGAGVVDSISFQWNATHNTWDEVSRSLALA